MSELVRFGFRKLWEGRSFIVRVAVAGMIFVQRAGCFSERCG